MGVAGDRGPWSVGGGLGSLLFWPGPFSVFFGFLVHHLPEDIFCLAGAGECAYQVEGREVVGGGGGGDGEVFGDVAGLEGAFSVFDVVPDASCPVRQFHGRVGRGRRELEVFFGKERDPGWGKVFSVKTDPAAGLVDPEDGFHEFFSLSHASMARAKSNQPLSSAPYS